MQISGRCKTVKKTYVAPSAKSVAFETEDILGISFPGTGSGLLTDSDTNKSSATATDKFGGVDLF